MLLRRSSSSLFGALLAMIVAGAPGAAHAADPPKTTQTKQAPAKKKPAKASKTRAALTAEPKTRAPLTVESLGLTDTPSLSALKAADAPAPAAPAAPTPPPPAAVQPPPAPVALVVTRPRDRVSDPPRDTRRRITLAVNPLPIIAGRYGIDLELMPAAHHAIVSSAWLQTFPTSVLERLLPAGIDASGGAQARLGGELGYRLYSGRGGPEGLFVGGSGVLMPLALPRLRSDLHTEVVSFDAYGGALDIGAQVITSAGLTIGGGLGAMALAYTPPASAPLPAGAPKVTVELPHVLPRLLFATGWSF